MSGQDSASEQARPSISAPTSDSGKATTPAAGRLYALRGAISVDRNEAGAILESTKELMSALMERNRLEPDKMVSCIFTSTQDLNAEFPAVAARELGLQRVPLICTQELAVPGSLERCIRVMIHYYGSDGRAPQHVYLKGARTLRSDLDSAQ